MFHEKYGRNCFVYYLNTFNWKFFLLLLMFFCCGFVATEASSPHVPPTCCNFLSIYQFDTDFSVEHAISFDFNSEDLNFLKSN